MQDLRYLIVEDHEFQRSMLEQALRLLGASTIHIAANGAQAMRLLRDPAIEVDVVITDLMMPDVDGIELIPLLRKAAPCVSLVLSSADVNVLPAAEAIARAAGLPVLGVLSKPLTPEKLRPVLEAAAPARPRR